MKGFRPSSLAPRGAESIRARAKNSKSRPLIVERLEDRRLMATIDLATLTTGTAGATIYGAAGVLTPFPGDHSGSSVSNAGDVNGDGFDDLIIGAYSARAPGFPAKTYAGQSYLIFGRQPFPSSTTTTIDLASPPSSIRFLGADSYDISGRSVSAAGDVNGDGFDDLIIGAQQAGAFNNQKIGAGESYVVFGKSAWNTTPTIDLATLGAAGITIFGADANDYSGSSVSSAGDMNGDGFDDLVIGAKRADSTGNARPNAGESYVIYGSGSLPQTIDLATPGTVGLTIFGASGVAVGVQQTGDYSGASVSSAGDVNGDGFDDLVIGAYRAYSVGNAKIFAGEGYLIYGGASLPASIDLAALGSAGVTIFGIDSSDYTGISVSAAGDINGDGFDDLVLGAEKADGAANAKPGSGESYVIFGGSSLPGTIDLSTGLGSAGIIIYGANDGDYSGSSVSAAGDVNGDGFDDLIIGAPYAGQVSNSKVRAGESYVVFGGDSLPPTIDLASLANTGITIFGAFGAGVVKGDYSGKSVSNAGDINGDGFDDVIIGAPSAGFGSHSKAYAGESYVIFGGNGFTNSVTSLGSATFNTLNGTAGINVMNGAGGPDILVGNGGADVLLGGQGNDIIAVSDLTFKRIVGGSSSAVGGGIVGNPSGGGFSVGDTLRLDGNGLSLNLTTLRDNRILGIEIIDITGSGNNTLTLNQREVLNISDETNTLLVKRNSGDTVNIGTGWTQAADETINSVVYNVYTQGQARLKVLAVAVVGSSVVNRQIFYNRSSNSTFGDGTGNPTNAIDSTKSALLPGQTSAFANYTNYARGLNGIVVDLANVTGTPTAADFQLATWNGIASSGFAASNAVATVTVIPGGGLSGSTRVKIEFPDNAIRNTWLRVTVLANANTSLLSNDVFYFGNAVADMNVGNSGSPLTVEVSSTDVSAVRQNLLLAPTATISNVFDLNKDGRVNALDTSLVRQSQSTNIIRFFTAPASLRLAITPTSSNLSGASVPVLMSEISRTNTSQVFNLAATSLENSGAKISLNPTSIAASTSPVALVPILQTANNPAIKATETKLNLTVDLLNSIDQFFATFTK